MRRHVAIAALLAASIAQGQEPKKYQSGQLLQMESLQCTVFVNPTSAAKPADSTVCQEYVVQADDILYHLRPRETKHVVLLPVGKEIGFRIEQGRFFVHTSGERKEHEYRVISMEHRERTDNGVQTALKINHLQ